jgi:hypothetical protein
MILSEHMSEDKRLRAVVSHDYKVELFEGDNLIARIPGEKWNAEETAEDWCLGELTVRKVQKQTT